MIPAKNFCPVGWTTEYDGYLMSGYVADMKTSYQCVDKEPDVLAGRSCSPSVWLSLMDSKSFHIGADFGANVFADHLGSLI